MRKRIFSKKYTYGSVLASETQNFKKDLYKRIGLKKLFKSKKILDLGCGHGTDSIILVKFAKKVYALDVLKYEEWKLFTGMNIKFDVGDSANLPYPDNFFDGVYLKDLLHHVEKVDKTLDEIKRVTKNGGFVVILEGNRYNPLFYFLVTRLRGHDHFTQKEFNNILGKKFEDKKILHLEAYPPFFLKMNLYKYVLIIEKIIEKFTFLSPLFAYNVAIVTNQK